MKSSTIDSNILKGYKQYLRLEKALSAHTIEAYLNDLYKLLSFLEKEGIPVLETQLEHLEAFSAGLHDIGIHARSQARILSGIRSFFRFLIMTNRLQTDPSELLEPPKIGFHLPEVLTLEEIDNLIGSIDLSTPEGQRNRTILETLYSCGLRVSELCNLKLSGLYLEEGFIKELHALCEAHDTVLICDEIQCGYGRSGKFFAHQHTGIRPDIITVAKGIGNGFPMGGVLISPKFTPVYGQLGTTFGGNHLACAAAIAVLDVMKQENLVENAAKVGAYLMEELKKFPQIKEVRGQGLMIGMEFEEPIKDIRRKLLFEKKVFTGVSGTNVIRLLPPLCLSMEEAEEFLKRFKEVL